jgi:hypothetical protein
MAYRDVVLADTPWAYWRGPISAGQLLDDTGNGRHLNVSGGLSNTTSILPNGSGTALVFPGDIGSYADRVGDGPLMGNAYPMSVEAWVVSPITANKTGCVFCFSTAIGPIHTGNINNLTFHRLGDNNVQKFSAMDGRLAHIVWVADPTAPAAKAIKVYFNGVAISESTTTSFTVNPAGTLRRMLGQRYINSSTIDGTSYFEGTLQEVAVYETALTEDQVIKHYRAGVETAVAPAVLAVVRLSATSVRVFFNKGAFGAPTAYAVAGGSVTSATYRDQHTVVDLTMDVNAPTGAMLTIGSNVKDAEGNPFTTTLPLPAIQLNLGITKPLTQATPSAVRSNRAGRVSVKVSPRVAVTATASFLMRAWRTDTKEYVIWYATTPDFTGAQSGAPVEVLETITLLGNRDAQ